jgi:hypothetical protein
MTDFRKTNSFTSEEKKGKTLSRRFLGKVPAKTSFDKSHLKAYTKGKTHFRYGFESYQVPITVNLIQVGFETKRRAKIHEVQQEYYLI